MNSNVDVVVVGAGSAGISAAKALLAQGRTIQIVEAKDRTGGRATTRDAAPGTPWDPGAYWLHHSEDNFFAKFAAESGVQFEDMPRFSRMWIPNDNGGAWADDATMEAREAYFDAAFAAIDKAGNAGLDIAASEVVPPNPRFHNMFRTWYAALSGAEPEYCSTLDQSRYRDGLNLRIRPGYGALLASYAMGLDVELNCPVKRIRWDGDGVSVETAKGTIAARAVVISVSTSVLARRLIAFEPELPAAYVDAIERLPLGTAEKVALAFDRDVFDLPDNSHVQYEHQGDEGVRFQIKPGGYKIAIGYLAGHFAEQIEKQGTSAMADFAESYLVKIFGADIKHAIVGRDASHWRSDPYIGGGYSYAVPGAAGVRDLLSQPINDRLFFAGEACSIPHFGTVNGANESGFAAANAVLQSLS
jgi:monoamine oxidase